MKLITKHIFVIKTKLKIKTPILCLAESLCPFSLFFFGQFSVIVCIFWWLLHHIPSYQSDSTTGRTGSHVAAAGSSSTFQIQFVCSASRVLALFFCIHKVNWLSLRPKPALSSVPGSLTPVRRQTNPVAPSELWWVRPYPCRPGLTPQVLRQ